MSNGLGFEPTEASEQGNGLSNMAERLAEIGGRSKLISKTGQGTRVEIQLPLGR